MAGNLVPLPPLTTPWVNKDGSPSQVWRQYLLSVDKVLQGLAGASVGSLKSADSDAAAAAAGVPVSGLYQTAGVVKIRQA